MENRKERTKARLRDAMTQLLQEKTFDQITTTELVKVAKISRSGFYTHYQDKYEMIEQYQIVLLNTIQYVFEKNDGDLQETMLETYEFLNHNEIYAALLSENGSKEIHQFMQAKLKSMIEHSILPQGEKWNNLGRLGKVYAATYYANAIFGLTQAWIRRKRKETPAEISKILSNLIH
ncbi:TetR/AcrR family transcriptional regulator [Lactococcus garvieae]|uniref:Transcriptional regulator, TetR family n=1 Tax=Lactococcus garvieae DCC43 TaxID=1231377 RepID=K2NVQ9_9LACT|nr:TetR-like C-terminal domain-containing protein [Lactococcus garvieae]EKF51593.1 Transcriptional regulator, TetR family [Lactococcus garvieae DCC43]QPS71404.1 TetR/AcrR family transcriptional regulator C-terminal domain-containing protein [Lactococcus garvieae]